MATITGSSTTFLARWRSSPAATASMMALLASMPILTAAISMSSKTASSWARTKSAGTSWIALTARVFCAVSAVITEQP